MTGREEASAQASVGTGAGHGVSSLLRNLELNAEAHHCSLLAGHLILETALQPCLYALLLKINKQKNSVSFYVYLIFPAAWELVRKELEGQVAGSQ